MGKDKCYAIFVTNHQKSTEVIKGYVQLSKEAETDIMSMYGTLISQLRGRYVTNRTGSLILPEQL